MKFMAMQRSSAPLVASARGGLGGARHHRAPDRLRAAPWWSSLRRSGAPRDRPSGSARRHRRVPAPCRTRRTAGGRRRTWASPRGTGLSRARSRRRGRRSRRPRSDRSRERRVHLAHHRAVHREPAGDRRAAGRARAGEQERGEREQARAIVRKLDQTEAVGVDLASAPRRRRSAWRSGRWSRSAATSERSLSGPDHRRFFMNSSPS